MPLMRFVSRSEVRSRFEGKSVAIVGSGPGCAQNEPGYIDSHDVVVRVNNFKILERTGSRTDVFYSFFGHSIRKTKYELKRGGVKLCICKCPDAHAIQSEWHRLRGKMNGVDFRWIYQARQNFWFCDTYIPTVDEFLASFELLGRRVPTTGFSAILEVLSHNPKSVFLTGFDFYHSKIHNVTERWKPSRHTDDPIGHAPERELEWLKANYMLHPITFDAMLAAMIAPASGRAA